MARPTSSSYVHRRSVVAVVCVSARCHRLLSRLPMAIPRGTHGGPTPSPERTHYAALSASFRRQGPHLQDRPSESGNRQRDRSDPQTAVIVNHQDRPG